MLKVCRGTGSVRLRNDVLQPYIELAQYSMPDHHTLMSTTKVRHEHGACYAVSMRVLPSIIGSLLSLCLTTAYAGNTGVGIPNPACMPERDKAIEITLPGTKTRAGTYLFRYADSDESELTSKMGAFLPNGQFLYIEGSAPDIDAFDVGGDTTFGLYGNYLVVDSFAFGSSYSRRMFLFTYTEQSVQLLDVISDAYGLNDMFSLKFIAAPSQDDASFESRRKDYRTRGFSWMDIAQRDNDTHPEIKLLTYAGNRLDPLDFELFVEVIGEGLHVDLNPRLYESLFLREFTNSRGAAQKSGSYYIYAFLANKLYLDEIKAESKEDKKLSDKIIPLLEHADEWDKAFHMLAGAKPKLNQCNPKRR